MAKDEDGSTRMKRKAYEQGILPDGQVRARALRWIRKLFLEHFHAVAYVAKFGKSVPVPYPIGIMHHGHLVEVPDWPHKVPAHRA